MYCRARNLDCLERGVAVKLVSPRHKHDYYRTPEWCVWRLLEEIGEELPSGVWLDPCAGDGAIVKACADYAETGLLPSMLWDVYEIREEERETLERFAYPEDVCSIDNVMIGDSLQMDWCTSENEGYALIASNPPFSISTDFLIKALSAPGDPMVIYLQRTSWLASGERGELMREYPPDVFPLPNRPRFKPDSVEVVENENGEEETVKRHGTDMHDYAWFRWPQGEKQRKAGICRVLQTTPLAERRRWEP
jgi:hypothetical protein